MRKKKLAKKTIILLLLMTAVAAFSSYAAYSSAKKTKRDCYDEQIMAAENMTKCMEEIKSEKEKLSIEICEEDRFNTGLLGEEHNFITTTLGDVAAKRTVSNPDMAAMMVVMLKEAGLKEGDALGCSFSGSFPGLNIATLCACDVLGIRPVYICSCGASTYGANNVELSFPEMAVNLYNAGLISELPALITPGGGGDTGKGIDEETFALVWERIEKLGVPTLVEEDFTKNIEYKENIYESENIKCFLTAGGNISALGYNMVVDFLGQGILKTKISSINSGSGLLERYLHKEMPCILLLNIRQLMTDYDMPFDPVNLTKTGEANIYYDTTYNVVIPISALLAEVGLMIAIRGKNRQNKREN